MRISSRYAQALADRGELIDKLLQPTRRLTPEQLFEQLVSHSVSIRSMSAARRACLTMDVIEDFTRELIELQLLQAVVRTESIEVKEVDIRADTALEVARRYRRDWMNTPGLARRLLAAACSSTPTSFRPSSTCS